jgi:hypothetical protein
MMQVLIKYEGVEQVNDLITRGWSRQRCYLAMRRAVHKTGRYIYTRVVRQISAGTGIQQKKVRARFVKLSLPKEHKPIARIRITEKGTPLIELKPKQTSTGVTFQSGSGREERVSAFKAKMPGGHIGIFRRVGPPRLPIREQYQSVVIEEMQKHIEAVRVDATARLKLETQRQIDLMISSMRRGGRMRSRSEVGQTASVSTPQTRMKWRMNPRSLR